MKQLFLLRHGEASFFDGSDYDRSLTSSGVDKLKRMSQSLENEGISIDYMHCSTARRTVQTADIIKDSILIKESNFIRQIYEGGLEELVEILETTPSASQSCILIGHNPVISLLLAHITGESYLGMQPGMLANINLEIDDWKMIGMNTGTLKEIIQ